jgi:hypothetical protein
MVNLDNEHMGMALEPSKPKEDMRLSISEPHVFYTRNNCGINDSSDSESTASLERKPRSKSLVSGRKSSVARFLTNNRLYVRRTRIQLNFDCFSFFHIYFKLRTFVSFCSTLLIGTPLPPLAHRANHSSSSGSLENSFDSLVLGPAPNASRASTRSADLSHLSTEDTYIYGQRLAGGPDWEVTPLLYAEYKTILQTTWKVCALSRARPSKPARRIGIARMGPGFSPQHR